jgi:hypothetical protein
VIHHRKDGLLLHDGDVRNYKMKNLGYAGMKFLTFALRDEWKAKEKKDTNPFYFCAV